MDKFNLKRHNFFSGSTPVHIIVQDPNVQDPQNSTELTALSLTSLKSSNYLTMTGTIKRGKYPEKNIDLQLSVTPDHLSKLEKRMHVQGKVLYGNI